MPGLGDFGERRCVYAWYGPEDTADSFSGIVHDTLLGRPFRISYLGLQWTMKTHRSSGLQFSQRFTAGFFGSIHNA